jgi:5-methylphenazine-1-carboxylate 1-monooxygenase
LKALIIGGGIGGLTTALCLHDDGIEVEVFEQVGAIRELGVGINILPHAVQELAALGLLERLDATGLRTKELIYCNRFGQRILTQPRGLDAGYPWPQFSIHRGQLQGLLYQAVRERIGDQHVHLGHHLAGFDQDTRGVTARFAGTDGRPLHERWQGDLLIGADGIHSVTRAQLYPEEGPPRWNGHMLWRGAVESEPFLSGRSMIIAGDIKEKVVLYPLAAAAARGQALVNWAVWVQLSDGSTPPPRREDWSRPGNLADVLPHLAHWTFDWFDVPALMRKTPVMYEYPMCDRDPLPRWSFGRVTLLGDAAHPLYPVGSNGAAQAILDARALGRHLAAHGEAVTEALTAYEAERRPATAQVVLSNRQMGPERVIDLVAQRAPYGFERRQDVLSDEELTGIVGQYAQIAGFAPEQLRRPT